LPFAEGNTATTFSATAAPAGTDNALPTEYLRVVLAAIGVDSSGGSRMPVSPGRVSINRIGDANGRNVSGIGPKVAVTFFAPLMVTLHGPVPEQSPDHPVNMEPSLGIAVSVTTVLKA